jgi:hypothetical protein
LWVISHELRTTNQLWRRQYHHLNPCLHVLLIAAATCLLSMWCVDNTLQNQMCTVLAF